MDVGVATHEGGNNWKHSDKWAELRSDEWAELHVDGVGMLLAQWFVLLGVEWLSLQVHVADCTDEAGVVPGVAQSFDELIPGFHGEVTAVTLSAEQGDVVFLTVRLSILHVEEAVSKGSSTGCTHEAGGVPRLPQSVHYLPHDLGVAASTGGGKELLVAVLAVDAVLLLHEADISQRHVAVVTVELLGVPGPSEGHQEGAPDDAVAGPTKWRAAAGSEPLRPLSHAPGHRHERGRAGADGAGAGGWRPGRGGVGEVDRRGRGGLRQRQRLDLGGGLTRVELASEISVADPGRSVGGGRTSRGWSRGSSWGAGLWWDWSWSWLGRVNTRCGHHLLRGGANRDLD